MKNVFSAGDLVLSRSGRDKGRIFLVIGTENDRVIVADGKTRKIGSFKKKNGKHLELLLPQADVSLAERIGKGVPTSNERLKKRIRELSQKIEED